MPLNDLWLDADVPGHQPAEGGWNTEQTSNFSSGLRDKHVPGNLNNCKIRDPRILQLLQLLQLLELIPIIAILQNPGPPNIAIIATFGPDGFAV